MSRRGENIYKRKDGRWEGRYVKQRINGKAKYGYVYAKTYKEAKEKLNVCQYSKEEAEEMPDSMKSPSDVTLKAAAEDWLEFSRPRLKESSVARYRNLLTSYLFPYLGEKPVEMLARDDISGFCHYLQTSGGQKQEGLSPKTVSCILSVLKNILRYAAQNENLKAASMESIFIKQPQKPMRILSMSEQQKLSRCLCENLTLTNLGILVCLYTGIRIGEVCALKWEDIIFEEQHLYVNKTMQRIQNKEEDHPRTYVLVTEPKSECSIRRIPLPDDLFRHIVRAKCPKDTYFLTGQAQAFIEPRTMQNHFKSVLKECGIKDANFHALRHTFATRCVELGFDVKSLSEILGHASVNITMNRYVHPSMELKQKNMNRFSDLFAVK